MYEDVTYDVILQRSLDLVSEKFDRREGSIIFDTLSPISIELQLLYIGLDTMLKEAFGDTASRDYLILKCRERGIDPHEATNAILKGLFTPVMLDVPIGSGFNAGDLNFEVIKKNSDGEYQVRCETAGIIGNQYLGEIIPTEYIDGLETAELTELLIAGEDEEEVESLRERYLSNVRNPSTGGNKYDYYNWTWECAGIGAVKVFPLANGPGTVKVVIADSDKKKASSTLIEDVYNHIEELRPVGADISVVSVEERPITATAKIKLKNGINLGTVQSAFFNAFTQYLSDNAFNIDYISIAKVSNILFDTAGVEDYSDVKLNGNPTNIILEQEEVAVCESVSLEVM